MKRSHYTAPVNTDNMRIIRRISAAFKDIPGGQLLGATYDYTHRLIHFESENENSSELSERFKQILAEQAPEKIKLYDRVSSLLKNCLLYTSFSISAIASSSSIISILFIVVQTPSEILS